MLHCVFERDSGSALEVEAVWLSAAERQRLDGLRFEKRRRDWLLGRWTAKRAVAEAFADRFVASPPLAALEIETDPSGAPFARLAGERLPLSLSISHSGGAAFCAALWADSGAEAVGADLERVEPRDAGLARDFFTDEEVAACGGRPQDRDLLVNAVWSAKEAVLKALRRGTSVDTRSVTCLLEGAAERASGEWRPFSVRCAPELRDDPAPIRGFWQVREGYVLTLAVSERDSQPGVGAAPAPSGRPRYRS